MDLLLPGPPLAEWLLASFAGKKMALWTGPGGGRGRAGRAAQATLSALRARLEWQAPAGAGGFDGLVVLAPLGVAEAPDSVLAAVQCGGWLVELVHPPPVPLWRPTRWRARGALIGRAAELRAGAWLSRGCFALEQWAPVDLPRLLVTFGRVRAIPGA